MIITNKLKMNLQAPGIAPIVHAVQNDSCSRNLEITVLSGNQPFVFPDAVKAIIRFRKSDGKGGEYDTLPDGTPAWWVKDNLLTVVLAPQVLTTPGFVTLTVTLIAHEKQLSVFPIQIAVQPVPYAAGAQSEDYLYVTGFLTAPASAKIGQQFRVAAVNEAGRVTEVEAFDPEPLSGGGMTEEEFRSSLDAYLQEYPMPTAFYITIVGENGSYTANKTRTEVDAAFAAGRPVFCIFTGEENNYLVDELIMPFICYMDGMALFSSYLTGVNWIVVFGDTDMIMVLISESLTGDNLPEALPNPNALTFNGAVSGTYDGSQPLTITIPSGSGEQGPQGEPGQDGFSPTITVTNTYSPTTLPDGTIMSKINGFILKITDVNGTVSKQLFYGKDGKDGTDGYTPVRGVDYWTDSDKETIIQEVITALGTPVFGTVDENNTIILTGKLVDGTYTLKYEDAEGNVTTIGTLIHTGNTTGYTNLADPGSADWKENSRINSSLEIVAASVKDGTTGGALTNYIPCKAGDVIRVKGLNVAYYYSNAAGDVGRSYAYFYGEDKTLANYADRNIPADDSNWINTGDSWQYTVGAGLTSDTSVIQWCRMQGYYYDGYAADSVIITVNQEIV